ncbi:hypothetical protein ACRAWF_28940 [Streptomyces sp. L7]
MDRKVDLCRAVGEMKRGLIDADLGHGLRGGRKATARSHGSGSSAAAIAPSSRTGTRAPGSLSVRCHAEEGLVGPAW